MHKRYKHAQLKMNVDYTRDGYVSHNGNFKFPHSIIENSNEWTKVDLGWEIVRFTDGFNEYYKTDNNKFTINLAYFYELDVLLSMKGVNILSIMRTRDKKVFTIGDYMASPSLGKITYFEIDEDGKLSACNAKGSHSILTLKTSNKLFSTKDNVDIYPGEDFYYIGDAYNVCKTKLMSGEKWNSKLIVFADQKKAIDYAKTNAPTYKITKICYKHMNKAYLGDNNNGIFHLDSVFNQDKMEIFQIKRISDNALFEVGDKIVSADIINIVERFEFLASGELRVKCSNAYLDINSLKKPEMITICKSVLLKMINECSEWQSNLSHDQRTKMTLFEAQNQKISSIFEKYMKNLNV